LGLLYALEKPLKYGVFPAFMPCSSRPLAAIKSPFESTKQMFFHSLERQLQLLTLFIMARHLALAIDK